jgi:hypothetical protein
LKNAVHLCDRFIRTLTDEPHKFLIHENRLPNIAIPDVFKRLPANNKDNNTQRHPGISMTAYPLRILSDKAVPGS